MPHPGGEPGLCCPGSCAARRAHWTIPLQRHTCQPCCRGIRRALANGGHASHPVGGVRRGSQHQHLVRPWLGQRPLPRIGGHGGGRCDWHQLHLRVRHPRGLPLEPGFRDPIELWASWRAHAIPLATRPDRRHRPRRPFVPRNSAERLDSSIWVRTDGSASELGLRGVGPHVVRVGQRPGRHNHLLLQKPRVRPCRVPRGLGAVADPPPFRAVQVHPRRAIHPGCELLG